ncbi:trypsin-like serine protease [Nocardioides baculatus]|uniref:Trypsin-like serine protease n=1 Tax=Nocardioides baculatus TaxID=2801337 RepID=A0ABS1L5C7_9ACTN|nr:trypsin-like serine protease [Nocardioides baculatus]MBL0746889.1 trypsin-like serine protease [Nocardioides baculatus]
MSFLTARRGRIAAAAAGALALLAPSAAHAITNGEPTSGYTNVGSFVVEVKPSTGEPYLIQLCTGTMVSPRVVLTASHCMVRDDYAPDWGHVYFTLDQRISDGTWQLRDDLHLLDGTPTPHPGYTGRAKYRFDVGAFVLDDAVTGVPYAELADVGYLDDKSLRGTPFTAVGYGIERYAKQTSTQAFLPPKERMMTTQPLVNVHRDYVLFSMNLARGLGGTCYGDSGGPKLNASGEVVAVVTTGDIPCKSTDQATRTDTSYAHAFVADVIADNPAPS